uniref:Putative secreted protein n=1 Tax=Ixodes ricinus TaxID=34613 RepID=A0A6B0U592_IXORI
MEPARARLLLVGGSRALFLWLGAASDELPQGAPEAPFWSRLGTVPLFRLGGLLLAARVFCVPAGSFSSCPGTETFKKKVI